MAVDETGREAQMGDYPRDWVTGEQLKGEGDFLTNYYNLFGNVSRGDFSLDMFHFHHERDKFGITPVHEQTGMMTTTGEGASLRFNRDVSGLDLETIAYYSQHSYSGDLLRLGPSVNMDMNYSGHQYGMDLIGSADLSYQLRLLSGVGYTFQKTDPYRFDGEQPAGAPLPANYFDAFQRSYDTYDISVFSQLDYIPVPPLRIVAGLRYNNNADYGATAVPRASLVYRASEDVYLKALYGAAFRNPSFFEKYVNTANVLYGDPELDPERIDTYELGANVRLPEQRHDLQVSLFHQTTSDKIARSELYGPGETPPSQEAENRVPDTSPTRLSPGYGNTDGQIIMGVEIEVSGELVPGMVSHRANISFKTGEEVSDGSDIQYLDKLLGNYLVSVFTGDLTNTLVLNYVGPREGYIHDDSGVTGFGYSAGDKVTIDPHLILNLKSSYRITESITLSASVMNILEQEIQYPEYIRRNIAEIPGDPDRRFYGELSYSF